MGLLTFPHESATKGPPLNGFYVPLLPKPLIHVKNWQVGNKFWVAFGLGQFRDVIADQILKAIEIDSSLCHWSATTVKI